MIGSWHQQVFVGVRLFLRYRKYPASIMISKGLDGDIALRAAEAVKLLLVRGSSSRSGRAALKAMISRLSNGCYRRCLCCGRDEKLGSLQPVFIWFL